MSKEITVMAVRVDNETGRGMIDIDVINNKDFLKYCYGTIDCRTIELVEIEVAPNKYLDMWVDEEFLLKEHHGFYALTNANAYTRVIGNFVITSTNKAGDTCSVPKNLMDKVKEWVFSNTKVGEYA